MKETTSEGLRVHKISYAMQSEPVQNAIDTTGLKPGMELTSLCEVVWFSSVVDSNELQLIKDCRDCLYVEYLLLGHAINNYTKCSENIRDFKDDLVVAIKRRDEIVEQLHPTK